MSSTEARARWLHFADRCIVDEDYKGASRPSSTPPSSSKSESNKRNGDGVKAYDSAADTKWWLHQQPKDNTHSFWDTPWETFPISMDNDEDVKIQELEAVMNDTLQKKSVDNHLVDFDPYECIISDKPDKLFSEMESQWTGIKKNEPWWRTNDLNDLASFVSHKSLEHFDNCDLPRPQRNKKEGFVSDKGLASLDHERRKEISNSKDSMPRSPTLICKGETQQYSSGCSPCGLDNLLSNMNYDEAENLNSPNTELSKAQLLEALSHSQKRAREAEKAAQEACNEKEHVVTLFLRQASHLFAYKQWLRILQLETLCLELRHHNCQQIYSRFPNSVPAKNKPPPKRVRRKGAPRYRTVKSFGSFVLGLALVGAGLLLGWTLGWLFPSI